MKAKVIILAAGALGTPKLLLASASPDWPNGLANDSGLVGRNLMRHYIDIYAVFPKTGIAGLPGNHKELAFNDLYEINGKKFGTIQSFGAMPPAQVIVEDLGKEVREGPLSVWGAWPFKAVKPVLRPVLGRLFSRSIMFASIMEDLPYFDNRVTLSEQPDKYGHRHIRIEYKIRKSEKNRIRVFRERIVPIFKPYRHMLLKQAENNARIAHVCGTCRFGSTPADSVLNADNKAHGLSNLYIVDSSFFPSSGGTNPGLTIAANALRVSDKILDAGPI